MSYLQNRRNIFRYLERSVLYNGLFCHDPKKHPMTKMTADSMVEGEHIRANITACSSSKNISVVFMGSSKESQNVINAEALFMKFLIEYNLPLSVDHVGPLFNLVYMPNLNVLK